MHVNNLCQYFIFINCSINQEKNSAVDHLGFKHLSNNNPPSGSSYSQSDQPTSIFLSQPLQSSNTVGLALLDAQSKLSSPQFSQLKQDSSSNKQPYFYLPRAKALYNYNGKKSGLVILILISLTSNDIQ